MNRYGLTPRDFKSLASADFAIFRCLREINLLKLNSSENIIYRTKITLLYQLSYTLHKWAEWYDSNIRHTAPKALEVTVKPLLKKFFKLNKHEYLTIVFYCFKKLSRISIYNEVTIVTAVLMFYLLVFIYTINK